MGVNTCYQMTVLVSRFTAIKAHIVFVNLALLSDHKSLLLQVLMPVGMFTLLVNCCNYFVIIQTVNALL